MAVYNLGTARGSIQIDTNDLKSADIALRGAGRSLVAFGALAIGAFGYVVGVGAQFEKEMSFVQAVTNASEADMKKLTDAAIELGKKGPFGPREVAAGFVDLAKAGLSAQEIIDGVGAAAVNLAAAGDIPFTQSAEVLVNILRAFNLPASEATKVIDSLAGAANASTVDISDMATSLTYAAAPAAALGVSVQDVNAALAILGNRGIKGSTAGTALRRVFINLAAPTAGVTKELKSLGIIAEDGTNKLFDSAGHLKTLPEVFQILSDSMAGFNDQQKFAALNTIFGARAVNSALILMGQGAAGFNAIQEQIGQTTAADVAAKRMDNLAGAIKRFKAAMEAVFVKAGSPFQKFLQNVVELARKLVLGFGSLPKGLQTFILGAIGAIGILSLLAGGFLLTIGNIVRMIRVFGELGKAFGAIRGLIGGVASAMRAMSASFLTNPVFLIIAALVALGFALYMLYKKNKKFREFIDHLWQTIQKIWDKILNFVKKIPQYFIQAWDWVKKHTVAVWDAVYDKVSGVLGAIIGFFERLPGQVLRFARKVAFAILGVLISAFNKVRDFFVSLPGVIGRALGTALRAVISFAKKLPFYIGYGIGFVIGLIFRFGVKLLEIIGKALMAVIREIGRLPGQIYRILQGVFSFIIQWGWKLIKFLFDLFVKIVEGIIRFLIALPGRIIRIFEAILTFIWEWGVRLVKLIFQIFWSIVTTVWDALSALPGQIWTGIKAAWNALSEWGPRFGSTAWNIGKSIVEGIFHFITGLPGAVWDILSKVIDAFTSLISRAFNAAKGFAKGLWEGFKDGLGIHSPSFIEKAMFAIEASTANGTKNLRRHVQMMQGLSSGIPTLNSGVLGLTSPAAAALTANGGGQVWNQNAPLIGSASIRDDRDIVTLAKQLAAEQAKRARAKGRRE